jgi:hypothetical protein
MSRQGQEKISGNESQIHRSLESYQVLCGQFAAAQIENEEQFFSHTDI